MAAATVGRQVGRAGAGLVPVPLPRAGQRCEHRDRASRVSRVALGRAGGASRDDRAIQARSLPAAARRVCRLSLTACRKSVSVVQRQANSAASRIVEVRMRAVTLISLAAVLALPLACSKPAAAPDTATAIHDAVADEARPASFRKADAFRKPAETLAFSGIR